MTDAETVEDTRRWILEHDPTTKAGPRVAPPAGGISSRRLVLAGVAAVTVLGLVGVLPGLLPDGGSTAPAAAIPMLDYAQPDGVDGAGELGRLAERLREGPASPETGRYFFEHRQYVGFSMHEVQVSEELWEVDGLVPSEDESYFWFDTADLSGGHRYVDDGEGLDHVHDRELPPGETRWGHVFDELEVSEDPQAVYDLVMRDNDQHQRFPGHYLIDTYNTEANLLSQRDRAVLLEALALAGDVTSYGEVTDRAGREGVAFGASRTAEDDGASVQVEAIIILDPATGKVLETDTVYPNTLPGAPAVVEEYDLVVESGFVDELPPCGTAPCPGASEEAQRS